VTAPPRKKPSLRTLLAAALCALRGKDGERLIPHEDAKLMTAHQVISCFQFNHYPIRHEAGGPAEHWNLDPELIPAHREITAKRDVPQIAKTKRSARKHAGHKAAMAAKLFGADAMVDGIVPVRRARKIPSRPFPKAHRPLRSRNNLRRAKT
jgi:hypothetical protein